GLDLGEIDHRNLGGQDARHLDEADVADACREQRVVEGIEKGSAFRATRCRRRHRDPLRHSLLLTAGISPPITVPPSRRREIFRHFTEPSNERKRKVTLTALRSAAMAFNSRTRDASNRRRTALARRRGCR